MLGEQRVKTCILATMASPPDLGPCMILMYTIIVKYCDRNFLFVTTITMNFYQANIYNIIYYDLSLIISVFIDAYSMD